MKKEYKKTVTAWSIHTSYFFTALVRDYTWVTALVLN